MRRLISSGSPYEPRVGISRAVRVGPFISVSGTAPLSEGRTVGVGDAGAQARRCLEIIREALERAGASLEQVVRTRTLLTRIEDWETVAAVHGEFFGAIRPANTIMQVSRFIDPDWLVELEADAILETETGTGLVPDPDAFTRALTLYFGEAEDPGYDPVQALDGAARISRAFPRNGERLTAQIDEMFHSALTLPELASLTVGDAMTAIRRFIADRYPFLPAILQAKVVNACAYRLTR